MNTPQTANAANNLSSTARIMLGLSRITLERNKITNITESVVKVNTFVDRMLAQGSSINTRITESPEKLKATGNEINQHIQTSFANSNNQTDSLAHTMANNDHLERIQANFPNLLTKGSEVSKEFHTFLTEYLALNKTVTPEELLNKLNGLKATGAGLLKKLNKVSDEIAQTERDLQNLYRKVTAFSAEEEIRGPGRIAGEISRPS